MDVELLHDPGHPGIAAVVLEEIASQREHQLSSNRLVAVHVGDQLHHWFQELAFLQNKDIIWKFQTIKI